MREIPIFTTHGEVGALLDYPYLYNLRGEWIGWVTYEREVYSVHGSYVGTLQTARRIVRPLSCDAVPPRRNPPAPPPKIHPPAHFPLAPLMPELPQNMIDVLDEASDLLPPLDFGEMRQDLD